MVTQAPRWWKPGNGAPDQGDSLEECFGSGGAKHRPGCHVFVKGTATSDPLPAVYDRVSSPRVTARRMLSATSLPYLMALDAERGRFGSGVPTGLNWLSHGPKAADLQPTRCYVGIGCTGRQTNWSLEELRRDADSGRVPCLLVARLDRLSRSVQLGMEIFDFLASRGIPIYSRKEPETWSSRSAFRTVLEVAEADADARCSRMAAGRIRSARRSGPKPLGTTNDPFEAEIVLDVMSLYGECTVREASRRLNENRVQRLRGTGRWCPSAVWRTWERWRGALTAAETCAGQ